MFKEFEDYVLAAAALYVGVVVGSAIYKEVSTAIDELITIKEESSADWDKWTLERYTHLSKKLDETNASGPARLEAHEHAAMLIEKHLAFYVINPAAREKALAFNQRYIDAIRGI